MTALFMNGVAESMFSGSNQEHESIQSYGHVVIITDPRHIDFGSKLSRRRISLKLASTYIGMRFGPPLQYLR
jgi:hypothetical protein